MIMVDANESPDYDMLINQVGIETQRGNYNQTTGSLLIWPDFIVLPGDKLTGVNHKQAVEAMADLDKVEEQLWRELASTPEIVLAVEGFLCPHVDGTFAGNLTRVDHKTGRGGNEYDEMLSRGKVIRQPFTRWAAFTLKCQEKGIPVVMTGDARGTVNLLARLHANPENNLFERLLPVRQAIAETDFELRAWLLRLMSIPGCGEEVARAIAAVIPNDYQLVMFLAEGGKLADLVLPSGRKLGPALEKRIRKFIGVN